MWKKLTDSLYKGSLEYYLNWRDHLRELMVALIIVLIIRSMIGVVYRIPTGSMIPTLVEGDMLIANRFYYGLKLPFTEGVPGYKLPAIREVESGDIIIFRAPREQVFKNARLFYHRVSTNHEHEHASHDPTSEERELLNKLNAASATYKRPFSLVKDEVSLDWVELEKNYIFLDPGSRSVTLRLPEGVYTRYEEEISSTLDVVMLYDTRTTLTFADEVNESIGEKVLRPLIATGSVVATALVNSPFFLPYRVGAVSFLEEEEHSLFSALTTEWALYPNAYTGLYREYVKRVVALPGDTVEIRGKRLVVNGEILPWDTGTRDPQQNEYTYFKENMPDSSKTARTGEVFTHPVRISDLELQPFTEFSDDFWPLDTDSTYAIGFRDHFGPVTVPADHYFVLGDNRDESLDSRYIGFVPKWEVKGIPMYIFLPGDRRGRLR